MKEQYKLSDAVSFRMIQIMQEAFLLNADMLDLLRQVRVQKSEDGLSIELTPEYKQQVVDMHEKLLANAPRPDQLKADDVLG